MSERSFLCGVLLSQGNDAVQNFFVLLCILQSHHDGNRMERKMAASYSMASKARRFPLRASDETQDRSDHCFSSGTRDKSTGHRVVDLCSGIPAGKI